MQLSTDVMPMSMHAPSHLFSFKSRLLHRFTINADHALTKVCQIQVRRFHFLVILISHQTLMLWIQKQGQHFILDMHLCFRTHLQFRQHSILYIHPGHHTTILQVRKAYKTMINFLSRYGADIFSVNS